MALNDVWLEMGLSYDEFWDRTVGEIVKIIKAHQAQEARQVKQQMAQDYSLAVMVAQFVGCVFNGKKIPSITDVMPELLDDEAFKRTQEAQQKKEQAAYIAQFRQFAERHNEVNNR